MMIGKQHKNLPWCTVYTHETIHIYNNFVSHGESVIYLCSIL